MSDTSNLIQIMGHMATGKTIFPFDWNEGRFSAGEASVDAGNGDQAYDSAAYNSGGRIADTRRPLIAQFSKHNPIVAADDGSTDRSAAANQEAAGTRNRFIFLGQPDGLQRFDAGTVLAPDGAVYSPGRDS
jgi:hypothetical protein